MNCAQRIHKMGEILNVGTPEAAGRGIADIVKFLMETVKPEKRHDYTYKLRDKIWHLNENEIAIKDLPPSSSMGQSITFIKTVLMGHDPRYIREVLKYIVVNLG